jgi:hypothetical protein
MVNEGFERETTRQTVDRVNWRSEEENRPTRELTMALVEARPIGAAASGFEAVFAYEDGSVKVFDGRKWTEVLPAREG